MLIERFKIVDLGVFPRDGDINLFGATAFDSLPDSVLGVGNTAKEAFEDALNLLSGEGLGVSRIEAAGREERWYSRDAEGSAEDLVKDDDEFTRDDDPAYHVGIRYLDPREDEDDGEDDGGDADDGPSGGARREMEVIDV